MKLNNKIEHREFPKSEQKSYKNVKIDWSKIEADFQSLLPYGKYVNKTLQWVIDNDDNYTFWMYSNNLIASWGLVKLKQTQVHKPTGFLTENGETWIGIREVPSIGIQSEYL